MESTSSTAMRSIGWASLALVVIGALNWLLVGLFKYDLVAAIFGNLSPMSRIIYTLVGVGGIYLAFAARSLAPHEGEGHASFSTRTRATAR